jgi:diguanylate cyclase (GGDEF)-like protein/PAS domain S-box-containing protein
VKKGILLQHKIHLAVGTAIAILLFVGALTYRSMIAAGQSANWVQHTYEVLENLQGVALSMESVESNTRGFVLTSDPTFLAASYASVSKAERYAAIIRRLTKDNPGQLRRFEELEELIDQKKLFTDMTASLLRANKLDQENLVTRNEQSNLMVLSLQGIIREMEGRERQLLTQRIANADLRMAETKAVLIAGFALALLITGIAGWFVARDNRRRSLAEEAQFAEQERAEVTLNSIGDAVACTDVFSNLTFFNIVAGQMAGWSWQEAAGRPMSEIFRILDGTSRETIQDPMQRAIAGDRPITLPSGSILVRRDGFEIPIEDSVAPIHDRDGVATGAVIVFHDVSATRAAALQVSYSAEHDFLTGLPNRLLLNDRIGHAIALAQRHNQHVALLFLDLDGFKYINDSLGHPIGDKLLQSVSRRLTETVRASDTVSRQGGDEFVILISEVEHPEDAAATAKRILHAVAEPHAIGTHELHITTSIGVSVYPNDGLDAETLIKNADTAMYQAKENGRQGLQFFKPAMNVRAVERQSIEESLRRAMERQEFTLHYQPKIDLETGEISGAEALLRWTHPTRGLISPALFIPVAEACGLIASISAWVLREACRQTKVWADAGLPLKSIAVNVSAMELRDESFLDRVFATLSETGVDPKSLELELTERIFVGRAESAAASILRILREKGIRVAIDDFGTGYSSLSYLRRFPVDAIKIDQSFVRQIGNGGDDRALVTAIIKMAQSLKLRVVAEGVETRDQLTFLRAQACDEAQGYYFSRPLPAPQFAALLETGLEDMDWLPGQKSSFKPRRGKAGLLATRRE